MKPHIKLDEEEIKNVKNFRQMISKPTLIKIIDEGLESVKRKNFRYDYVGKPSVCYVKPYYIFYEDTIIGKIDVNVRNDTITFYHNEKEYFFTWEEMKDNITFLSSMVIAYAIGFDDFENIIKGTNPPQPSSK
jgi:hypothetical protein